VSSNTEFEFYLQTPDIEEIRYSEINDKVNFWLNPNDRYELRVYLMGNSYERGFLGLVPTKLILPIMNHKSGMIRKIKSKSGSNVLIYCKLLSLEETEQQKVKEIEDEISLNNKSRKKYLDILNKPFDPKNKVFKFTTNNTYQNHIPNDTILNIDFKPLEDYLTDPSNICLNLVSSDKSYSFQIDTYLDNVVQIIRSHFHNGFSFEVKFKNDFLPNVEVEITPVKKMV